MKIVTLLLVFFLFTGCSPKLRQSYSKLSKPEKAWVIFHPFKAKKAYRISNSIDQITDSIANTGIIGNDNNSGHLDAFKHSFWMARLTQGIGRRAALSLGKAHEKGNYKSYKKRQLEDAVLPDKASTEMDLFNNSVGARTGSFYNKRPKNDLILKLLDSLQKGKLRVLYKDHQGNFLDCQHQKIPLDSLRSQWHTQKCLVPSNK
ncbi:MAG: hypothetical protein WBN17_06895 [Aureibaculum sp.]